MFRRLFKSPMTIQAGRVEKRLHDYCLKRTKAGKDCKDCPIKKYCHTFLKVTPALNLAIIDVNAGYMPPNFKQLMYNIGGGK